MLTTIEKEMAISNSVEYFTDTKGRLLFKLMSEYLSNNTELRKIFKSIDDDIFKDYNRFKESAETMIKFLTENADKEAGRKYTSGQLSNYFGVSITTIHNWIKEGRFKGINKGEANKQIRIFDSTYWESSNGDLLKVKDIVDAWEKSKEESRVSDEEEIKILKAEINAFEKKYGGRYEDTLKLKKNKTYDESKDEDEWVYYLRRLIND